MTDEPFLDWYAIWVAEHGRRAAAEARTRAAMDREIRWMVGFIVVWTAVVTGATGWVIWKLLPT